MSYLTFDEIKSLGRHRNCNIQYCDVKQMSVYALRQTLTEISSLIKTAEQQKIYDSFTQQVNIYSYKGGVNIYAEKFLREALADFKRNLQAGSVSS